MKRAVYFMDTLLHIGLMIGSRYTWKIASDMSDCRVRTDVLKFVFSIIIIIISLEVRFKQTAL